VEDVRLLAQKKCIQIETVCAASLPPISCDEYRIQQVLANLLSNAVKFTPEQGRVTVLVTLGQGGDDQARCVEVCVADTGIGIPTEDGERIFEKFYQSSHHRGESKRGTGLGLTIARHIVEGHGGKIWVESRLGQGSTFIFTVPVNRSAEDEEGRKIGPTNSGEGVRDVA
jgi:signal transduction histidine kinase